MWKCLLILLFLSSCTTTYKVKVDAMNSVNYVEPSTCQMKKVDTIPYTTTLQGDNLVISNADMGAFLKNLANYKQSVNEYQQCTIANEEYLKSVINVLIGG